MVMGITIQDIELVLAKRELGTKFIIPIFYHMSFVLPKSLVKGTLVVCPVIGVM